MPVILREKDSERRLSAPVDDSHLTELMGGRIGFEDGPGPGTTIGFDPPLGDADAPHLATAASAA